MELTTLSESVALRKWLFMMSKIQNLNGTHNKVTKLLFIYFVVYDVKDTKFEWNSQQGMATQTTAFVVYDVKDTKFEWNSQQKFRGEGGR